MAERGPLCAGISTPTRACADAWGLPRLRRGSRLSPCGSLEAAAGRAAALKPAGRAVPGPRSAGIAVLQRVLAGIHGRASASRTPSAVTSVLRRRRPTRRRGSPTEPALAARRDPEPVPGLRRCAPRWTWRAPPAGGPSCSP
ncbi:hypothetical protein QJS66_03890 [Kocuria rhizophila]|nr:hypothetical protein QJS66_03890 [Kocuria rhizophila]